MICRASAHFKELFKMKVLVVVDMQNDFINGALGTPRRRPLLEMSPKRFLTLAEI